MATNCLNCKHALKPLDDPKCKSCTYENDMWEEYKVGDTEEADDVINHPSHYTQFPGVEVIDITEHLNFCMGNAVKYICRADFKGKAIEDLEKAKWYIEREIKRRKKATRV